MDFVGNERVTRLLQYRIPCGRVQGSLLDVRGFVRIAHRPERKAKQAKRRSGIGTSGQSLARELNRAIGPVIERAIALDQRICGRRCGLPTHAGLVGQK